MTPLQQIQKSVPQRVTITHKTPVGIISFLSRTAPTLENPDGEPHDIRSERFQVHGNHYKLVSFKGDHEWEVYRLDDDGSELFEGYALDVLPKLLRGELL